MSTTIVRPSYTERHFVSSSNDARDVIVGFASCGPDSDEDALEIRIEEAEIGDDGEKSTVSDERGRPGSCVVFSVDVCAMDASSPVGRCRRLVEMQTEEKGRTRRQESPFWLCDWRCCDSDERR